MSLKELKELAFLNPEVKAEYDNLEDEFKYWGELAMQAKREGVFKGDAMGELLRIAKEKGVSLDTNH